MNLRYAEEGKDYIVDSIETEDEELNAFLFSIGCYSGESVRLISRRKSGCVLMVKNSRYSIDINLAEAITVR